MSQVSNANLNVDIVGNARKLQQAINEAVAASGQLMQALQDTGNKSVKANKEVSDSLDKVGEQITSVAARWLSVGAAINTAINLVRTFSKESEDAANRGLKNMGQYGMAYLQFTGKEAESAKEYARRLFAVGGTTAFKLPGEAMPLALAATQAGPEGIAAGELFAKAAGVGMMKDPDYAMRSARGISRQFNDKFSITELANTAAYMMQGRPGGNKLTLDALLGNTEEITSLTQLIVENAGGDSRKAMQEAMAALVLMMTTSSKPNFVPARLNQLMGIAVKKNMWRPGESLSQTLNRLQSTTDMEVQTLLKTFSPGGAGRGPARELGDLIANLGEIEAKGAADVPANYLQSRIDAAMQDKNIQSAYAESTSQATSMLEIDKRQEESSYANSFLNSQETLNRQGLGRVLSVPIKMLGSILPNSVINSEARKQALRLRSIMHPKKYPHPSIDPDSITNAEADAIFKEAIDYSNSGKNTTTDNAEWMNTTAGKEYQSYENTQSKYPDSPMTRAGQWLLYNMIPTGLYGDDSPLSDTTYSDDARRTYQALRNDFSQSGAVATHGAALAMYRFLPPRARASMLGSMYSDRHPDAPASQPAALDRAAATLERAAGKMAAASQPSNAGQVLGLGDTKGVQ